MAGLGQNNANSVLESEMGVRYVEKKQHFQAFVLFFFNIAAGLNRWVKKSSFCVKPVMAGSSEIFFETNIGFSGGLVRDLQFLLAE